MSSTAPAQNMQVAIGDRICSSSSIYEVESFAGQGAFGTVAKCKRMADKKTVAIKMIKMEGVLLLQAMEEMAALKKIRSLDPDKCNIVRWYQAFTASGHICLEFEALDKSLHELTKERYFQPLLLKEIRPIVQQIATALDHLKSIGMVHADIKLQNVMLVNHAQEPYRVKVIDFGIACEVSEAEVGWYIQTRPYRAPEILLGLPFTEAIDIWSLGILAARLYLGYLLYPGMSEYDMIRYIVETQGLLPDHLLSAGQKTRTYFQVDYLSSTNLWKLKTPEQFYSETGKRVGQESRRKKFDCLYDLMHIQPIRSDNPADKFAELNDRLFFVDVLSGMLELDASKRLTPQQVLKHQFISMNNMVNRNPVSSYAQSCLALMDVCQNQTPTSDSGTAQQSLPPPADPLPCTSTTQTLGSAKSGIKRKAEDGNQVQPRRDRESDDSSDSEQYKRSADDRKRFRKGTEGPSTSYCSSQTQSPASPRLKRKRSQDCSEESRHEKKRVRKSPAGPSTSGCSSHTKSPAPPSLKRKNSQWEDDVDSGHERKRVRKSPAEPSTCSRSNTPDVHHCSTKAPISSQTESGARSGLKRKAADDETSDLMSGNERKRSAVW